MSNLFKNRDMLAKARLGIGSPEEFWYAEGTESGTNERVSFTGTSEADVRRKAGASYGKIFDLRVYKGVTQ